MNSAMLGTISWVLVIIGGINWLLIGLLNLNVVSMIFGESFIARLIYIVVGLGACYLLYVKFQKPKTGNV